MMLTFCSILVRILGGGECWKKTKDAYLKLLINGPENTKSEDNHENDGQGGEANVDSQHVNKENNKLENVAQNIGHFPSYYVNYSHRTHRTLKDDI